MSQPDAANVDDEALIKFAIHFWRRQFSQVAALLLPVSLNMALTLVVWVGVYEMKPSEKSLFYYMLDRSHNSTTGNDILDGMLNAALSIFILAVMSFGALQFALRNCRRVVHIYLQASSVLIMFGVFTSVLLDTFEVLGWEQSSGLFTFVIVVVYGCVGSAVFLMRSAPLFMHQFYVICNCSLVSLVYIRMFPTHTTWFVLVGVVLWDAFAVLNPIGPLRRIYEKAGEYSEQVLRYLVFTAQDVNQNLANQQAEASPSNESYESDSSYYDDSKPERNVRDALNDQSMVHLGMGDFVFFSLLVCKSLQTGSCISVLSTAVGILLGLIVTLALLDGDDGMMPALPVSVAVGMTMHFGVHLFVEPFSQFLALHQPIFL